MSELTTFANVSTCRGQNDSFVLRFTPSTGVDLTGAVATCRVVSGPEAKTALMTPDATSVMVGSVLEVTFSWTQEQSLSLSVHGTTFQQMKSLPLQVDLAFADDPTHPTMRFVGNLVVSPGGNLGA